METKIFEPMVLGWSDKLVWSKDELKQAAKLLSATSEANGGEIAPDIELDAETSNMFALQRAEGALARRVTPYARMLREKLLYPMFSKALEAQPEHVVTELVSHEWSDCIDINTAETDVLCKLPGISRALALQIIKYRKKNGPFSELAQLSNIEGLGTETLEALKVQAYCGTSEKTVLMTKELAAFIRRPTFQNYVELIAETKDALALSISENEDPKVQILAELKKALEDVQDHKFGVARNLGYTRASKVLIERKRKERAREISEKWTRAIDGGALLYDVHYFSFLSKLIECAKQSITVMMFFMKYEDDTDYVTNSLVDSLVKAHRNGLDVKVILDRDVEGDVIGSRLINQSVFDLLKKDNVPVLFDRADRMTHSKFVVVDGKHLVIGSHNWTGGSYWAYDDTSIYVESQELAQKYQTIFDGLWDEYNLKETSPIS
jgi:competence ComEA-like helix-hairpin-helix protein